MTKKEISIFFGFKDTSLIGRAFKYAEQDCPSILQKKGHYNKNMEVDYTLEECLAALSHIEDACNIAHKFSFTPATIQVFKENFIHRDVPYKMKQKRIKINKSQHDFLYLVKHYQMSVCATCAFLSVNTMNRQGARPSPYCNLYNCFINKVRPKRDIYKDKCESFEYSRATPLIFTSEGVFTIREINYKGEIIPKKDVFGIPQSAFKSKRKRNEPIVILRDGFSQ